MSKFPWYCAVALIWSITATANPLVCRFRHAKGTAQVTLTATLPWFKRSPPSTGYMTIEIEGLDLAASFPVGLRSGDASSKFEMDGPVLKSAKVFFNQGHQQVYIFEFEGVRRIHMDSPYGLFEGRTISARCL